MTPRDLARLQRMERELEEAKQALRLIPVRFARGASDAPTLIRIRRGNKIAEYTSTPIKVYGMKYTAGTSISTLSATELNATDDGPDTASGVDESYQDGLCWGTIVDTSVNVFVANKATPYGGSAQTDVTVNYCLPENAFVYCQRSVLVQKSGDPTILVPVYLTWRV